MKMGMMKAGEKREKPRREVLLGAKMNSYIALILDCTSTKKNLPMCFTSDFSECCGHQ